MRGASDAYHIPLAVELRGALDRTALRRARDALVARHEVLRTRIVTVAGAVFQEIDPADVGFPLTYEDLAGVPRAEDRLALLRREEATAPFDLARGPLLRSRLVTLGADRHVLLLTMHHIVSDGWSVGILTRELSALYAAFRDGAPDPLLPLPVQYADYAAWQQQWLSEGAADEQRTYWQEALAGAPTVLELPTDRPRPAEQDYRGGQMSLCLDEELTAALQDLGRRNGCSLSMTVLAGWALVLARLAEQSDVVIGTPAADRPRADLEGLIGFFVNTLALRIDFSTGPTVTELLKHVQQVTQSALRHQELPFEQVIDLVKPTRSLAHPPLFQVMFAWQSGEENEMALPGIEATPLESAHSVARFDLALSLTEKNGRITGSLDYATALLEADTAERYGRRLRHVLEQMVQADHRPVAELTLLDERERRQVLADFNNPARPGTATPLAVPDLTHTPPSGLVERFEAQVRKRPGQIAVIHEGERLDYATLDRRANRLAQALLSRGVRAEQVVGLHTHLSVDLVVGILGVLKAGAAYLPLDPSLPAERLTGMAADADAVLVLSNDAVPPDDDWLPLTAVEAEGWCEDPPARGFRPSGLAYVIYTSGSTGRPKGVAATHRGILNLLDYWLSQFGATPGQVSAMWPSFAFDASLQELMLPLTSGGILRLVPGDVRDDPEALMGWLREHRIVEVLLPPAYVKWICEAPEERLAGLSLRYIITGLEPLPEDGLHRLEQALPGLRVLNGYGPTETALYCTAYLDPRPLARQAPIGPPVANTRAYVLDERLRPAPIGVAGELYLAGAGLARG
ncbi:non-ribosomal peptide synthetase, partial [Streptomyces lasiicapitis]|uniref:non-ribosomal peptide synthetase n=1 Tax=Streptomyces lasiicapitis TaxID=1923961 RepID=UPI0036C7EDC2